MSRGLWFAAGASAGVYAAVRARRVAEIATLDGLRDRVGATVVGLRLFRDEVAQGKADAEGDVRARLGRALGEHDDRRELTARRSTHPDQSDDALNEATRTERGSTP